MTKSKKIIPIAVLLVCSAGLALSICKIIKYKIENNNINTELTEIENSTEIITVNDSENTEIIEQEETPPETNPYWDYIKRDLIAIDFEDLKNTNPDTVGWIQVDGTNINYPFVQTKNNEYYLTHSFDKSWNSAGWAFLDYRNNLSNFEDKNTIIYAHGRIDQTMFGSLKNILKSGWLSNTSNYTVKLSTEYENTLWQVFSVYHIDTTSDYIQTSFASTGEFSTFISMLKDRSSHDFNTTISANDRILTLSTCYDKTSRVVLHAKLIKREIR